jgi:hypothetical protein
VMKQMGARTLADLLRVLAESAHSTAGRRHGRAGDRAPGRDTRAPGGVDARARCHARAAAHGRLPAALHDFASRRRPRRTWCSRTARRYSSTRR